MIWLLVFLAVAVVIQGRQSWAIATSRRLGVLKEQRGALEAEKAALERQIRLASSRRVLGARAAQLGLHFPQDSEFVYFRLPAER
ncbi:MAG: hypothetical protein ABI587_09435 [Gemmatimonadales bacterium]